MSGRLAISERLVVVADATPLGDPLLDELLGNMAQSSKHWRLDAWLRCTGRFVRKPADCVADRLVAGHPVRQEKRFWLGPGICYLVEDMAARAAWEERLRTAILTEGPPDTRAAVLLAAARNTPAVRRLLPREHWFSLASPVTQYIRRDPIAAAVLAAQVAVLGGG